MEMKYYLCTKEINDGANDARNINAFISFAFNGRHRGVVDNYYGLKNQFNFIKGGIYREVSNDGKGNIYLIDTNGTSHNMYGFMNNFIEFNLEIDETAKRIIEKKKQMGHEIYITPLSFDFLTAKTLYYVECKFKYKISKSKNSFANCYSDVVTNSLVNGIINCYRRMRSHSSGTENFKRLIHL